MVSLIQLWLPIIVSAVLVFVVSSILHMVLTYHNSDYRKLANEDEVRAALAHGKPAPGQYIIPYCQTSADFKNPETRQKLIDGPVGHLRVTKPGLPQMGSFLGTWFIYIVVISALVADVAAHTLRVGAPFQHIVRVVGTVAFLAYAGAEAQQSIWRYQPWTPTIKGIIDGIIYGLVTAATFAWLWPKG
jgi:hypothetical protein